MTIFSNPLRSKSNAIISFPPKKSTLRLLFVLKFRFLYGEDSTNGYRASGLLASATLVVDMLHAAGVEAKLVEVIDTNDIDREVASYQPTHVIIEGLWVIPEKFGELIFLHPKVQWIVRVHSEVPFLAAEGMALDWIAGYSTFSPAVQIACNSSRAFLDIGHYLAEIGSKSPALYLPNYYPARPLIYLHPGPHLNVACLGAIRPLKNQLSQAMAAIQFARSIRKPLNFHITNGPESGGDQTLKNIRALFNHTHETLVEHPWMDHASFLVFLRHFDVGMSVSFSETFCITAADMVSIGLPVVVSPEVRWASSLAMANPNDVSGIAQHLAIVTGPQAKSISAKNRLGLEEFSENSRSLWLKKFGAK